MAIQTLHDTGSSYDIPSKFDGGVYQVATQDCVVGGVGDEFTINYSNDSLNVSFNAGSQAVIGGSFFKITSLEAITLVANSTIYLCANIDLSRPNGSTGAFAQRTSSNMQDDNINGSGSSRDLLLYIITTGVNGVISVQDKRNILEKGGVVKSELIDIVYPIGSIYMSAVATSPATLFGGSWTQLKDRFLLGAGDTYTNGDTGGEATHTLTISEIPSHSHSYTTRDRGAETSGPAGGGWWYDTASASTSSAGGGQAHNNMPPYLVVYMWRRIA